MNPHFIVHEPNDSVGVVVVDQSGAGEEVSGWVMETDETISMTATEVVPLGHKLALKDIAWERRFSNTVRTSARQSVTSGREAMCMSKM